jgi:putative transcriptional regulator
MVLNVAVQDIFTSEAKNYMPTFPFTQQAIQAGMVALQIAESQKKSQVEPEHLLAALLSDPTMTSARLLRSSGATWEVETHEHSLESQGMLKYSSGMNFVIEVAMQIVLLQGKESLDTEHLLWALVRLTETGKTNMGEVFQRYNVDLLALNQQLTATV